MTTTFARIDPETLEVTLGYNTNGGDKWAEGDLECLVPFDVLASHAVRSESGNITLVADPTKLQAKLEAQWAQVRTQQRQRLYESDWTCSVTDYEVPNKSEWVQYRQALRDLPDLIEDPTNFTWPLKPGEIPPTPVNSSRFGSLLEHAVEEVPVAEPVEEVPVAEPVEEVPVAEPVEEVTGV